MASGQVRPAGRSTPVGKGGMEEFELEINGGAETPFEGGGGL
jgi:hypothetical protein